MSIVERALDKVRREGGEAPPSSGTIGTVTQVVPHLDEAAFRQPSRQISIDRQALRSAGYLPEATQDRAFADQYRHIKRPLIAAATASDLRGPGSPGIIMMASALPGDGKTFTSINLALSMARERDISVVLVDGDLAKPHVSRIFGAEDELGLLDALVDSNINVNSLVLPTDVRGLSILPAGKPRDGATELLASERMKQIAADLQAHDPRRVLLFDSSPLLVTSESQVLATVVGRVVLVVRSTVTPKQAVLDAIAKLGAECPVSIVLNQGRPTITQSYYYNQGSYGDEFAKAK